MEMMRMSAQKIKDTTPRMAACVKGNKFDDALHLFSLMEDGPSDDSAPLLGHRDAASVSPSTSAATPSESLTSLVPPLVRDTYSYGTALNALGKKGNTNGLIRLSVCLSICLPVRLHQLNLFVGL